MKRKCVEYALSMVIIASSLMGCAAASQDELLNMINNGDQIEIEVATPKDEFQGTEVTYDWTRLDQLKTQPELRKAIDDLMLITSFGENSKNGILYINLEGNQEGNNTLYNVFANNTFRLNYWENEEASTKIAELAAENYVDIDAEEVDTAKLAALNGYFNLLNDAETGYANMDSTLTRLEAMSALFKANNQVVDDLKADEAFQSAVDPSNTNNLTAFASRIADKSYLDVSSGSLDEMTASGTITRGELVYMIVQQYFADEYNNVDKKADCYKDVKNGGDIAKKQKFADKEHSQSYELQYALQNADKGCPERMYKALAVAYSKGLITGSESRWDEGATKEDLLSMLTNAYLSMTTQLTADKGENAGTQIAGKDTPSTDTTDKTNTTTETGEKPQNDTSITDEDFSNIIRKYGREGSPEAFAEGRELLMKKWAGSLADPANMTDEERDAYQSDRAYIGNYTRTQEEKQEDSDKDNIPGYDLRIEEGTGLSYLVDTITGLEYHFGDMFPDGTVYYGQSGIAADAIKRYRYLNPGTDLTDEQIISITTW